MVTFLDTQAFYKFIQVHNLASRAEQWGSLTSCDQYKIAYELTKKYLNPQDRVLDWGSGNGHFSYYLTQNNVQTDAYSFDQPPAFVSSHPHFKHTLAAPNEPVALPYLDNTFDVVFSVGVLEHVHESGGDQQKSVCEIGRVLKSKGYFLVFHLPNKYTWIEFVIRQLNRAKSKPKHEHSKLFTKTIVEEMLQGTPFRIVESGRYNFLPRNSLAKLPKGISDNGIFCRSFGLVDRTLAFVCPIFCQNWFFVLQKQ